MATSVNPCHVRLTREQSLLMAAQRDPAVGGQVKVHIGGMA
ncbi:hypothetical protein ACFL6X_08865 [Candidatus Latescibacterota bacterium]